MNKIYRLVWNATLGAWVVASELAKGRHQGSCGQGGPVRRPAVSGAVVCASLSLAAFPVFAAGGISSTALPTGGTVTAGAGSISRSGNILTVNQSSQNLSLNWTSFNIGTHGTVDFFQPSSSSIAVNRIGGNSGSQILGNLDANGQVYLINPNGILFGRDAQVNVGGIIASTLDLSDRQLGSGTLAFSGSGTGSIINKGSITASGDLVALIGNQVINQGVISAQLGSVALAGGSAVTLTFSSDQLVGVQVDQSTLNNLVTNGQLIQADGGRVWMTAGAAHSLLASAVNNSGVVEARTFENHEGTITLLSGMDAGTTTVSGTLDGSAPNGGNGGNIETSGHTVNVADGATVTTAAPQGKGGNWLIDPADFAIAPSGGNMTGLQLSTSLGSSGSVTIESSSGTAGGSGNINVDDSVTVGGTSSLTLIAADNININGVINVGGTASLNLQTATANGGDAAVSGGTVNVGLTASGFSAWVALGSTSSLSINGNPYTIITSASALQGLSSNGYYALGGAIDASSISNFAQIPTFFGVFDGLGNTIFNLSTSASAGGGGLFGALTSSSVVSNLGLSGSVSGTVVSTDGLATTTNGTLSNVWVSMTVSNAEISGTNNGTINHTYAFGTVTPTASGSQFGGTHNGGLVGINNGTISNSFAATTVGGGGITDGGLVGINEATGTISNSTASGSISGGLANGGLVGENAGTISSAVATGPVAAGPNNVDDGGLVGDNSGAISGSYATGPVNGGLNESGGLVGQNTPSGTINDSFATGSATGVSGSRNGGLVGYNSGGVSNAYATGAASGVTAGGLVGINVGSISNAYATGAVTGATTAGGGLVGSNNGTVSVSYFDPTTTEQANGVGAGTSTGVTGLSPQQWLTQGPIATSAWDTTSIWVADAGLYPILQSLPYVLVTPSAGTSTYGNTSITASVGSTQLVIPAGWTVPDYPTTAVLSPSTPTWVGSATADSAATTAANGNPTYLFAGTGVTATGFQVATTVSTLTVDPAILLQTATPVSSTYGSTPSSLTGTVTGWLNGQSTASNASGLTWMTPATANSNVSNYAIDGSGLTLTGAAAGNYTLQQAASNSTALTIDPAALMETATPSSSTYGSTPSGLTGTVTGWLNGQSTSGNASGLTWMTPATTTSNVGSYAIDGNGLTLTGAAAGNYTLQQAASNSTALTIDPATLLETATAASSTYGSTPSGLTGSVTGWVNGQSTASNTSGNWSTPATANSNVGNYAINGSSLTLTGAAAGNYTLQQAASNSTALTIDPATLMETATPSSSTYGSTPSDLTGTVTGWVNGQSTASNTSGNWSTPATANSNVGNYAIDGSGLTLTGAAAGNYTLQQAASNGTALTIDPATLLETATPARITFGSTPSGLTGSVTGWVNGQSTASNASGLTWITPATANSNVGNYAIDGSGLTLTGAAAGNYTLQQAASNSTALTINPSPVTQTSQSYVSTILTNGGDLTNGGALTNGGIVPSQATPEPTIAPVQIPAGSAASTSGNAAGPQVNMTQAIGGNGTLVVIDNGVNLSSVPQSSATPASWERTSCAVH